MTVSLIGHDEALRQAAEAFASGRMHHAWLIVGIEGIGKMTLATHIAHHVLSNGAGKAGVVNAQDRVAKLIAAEAHPDMLTIRRATDDKTGEMRKVIIVDDARKIDAFLRMTATHGGWRVVIVDEAHALNRNAQNAILKILEEPPPQALILMTATTPGALLPTIRSRCRIVHLAPLDEAHMKTVLARAQPDLSGEALERLIALSGGSAGFALKIVRTQTLTLYDELLEIIASPAPDIARLHKLVDQISRKADAEGFEVVTTLLVEHLRQSVRAEAVAGQRGGALDHKLRVWDKVRATFALADSANLDRKLAFINAVGEISAMQG